MTTSVRARRRPVNDRHHDLGPCCICERTGSSVKNILLLNKRSPILGHGWGCFQCGLLSDGATAVVCDRCLGPVDRHTGIPTTSPAARLRFACRGFPRTDGRIPIDELIGEFRHDRSRHPGETFLEED
jgi:hypothetical protein